MVSHGYVLPTRGIAMQSDSSMSLSSSTAALLTLASHAESLDFSSLWVGDSILTRYRLEPLTTLASIAALTKKVQIGTAIYLLHLRRRCWNFSRIYSKRKHESRCSLLRTWKHSQ